jgi:hypothetical protein
VTRAELRSALVAVALLAFVRIAPGEPVASADERGPEVSSSNAKELGYEVLVDIPDEQEPGFKRLLVKFPSALGDLQYSHSSVIYSENGKSILSYDPRAVSSLLLPGRMELYILADQKVLPCLSFVSVYFGKSDDSDHPPTKYVSVNLASFVSDRPKNCKGKVDARNFY